MPLCRPLPDSSFVPRPIRSPSGATARLDQADFRAVESTFARPTFSPSQSHHFVSQRAHECMVSERSLTDIVMDTRRAI